MRKKCTSSENPSITALKNLEKHVSNIRSLSGQQINPYYRWKDRRQEETGQENRITGYRIVNTVLLIALFFKTPEKGRSSSISQFAFTAFTWKGMPPLPTAKNLVFQHSPPIILPSVMAVNILKQAHLAISFLRYSSIHTWYILSKSLLNKQ